MKAKDEREKEKPKKNQTKVKKERGTKPNQEWKHAMRGNGRREERPRGKGLGFKSNVT